MPWAGLSNFDTPRDYRIPVCQASGRSAARIAIAWSRDSRVRQLGVTMDDKVPMVTQERAYTSPIWYTP
jgi:hypothetical protein